MGINIHTTRKSEAIGKLWGSINEVVGREPGRLDDTRLGGQRGGNTEGAPKKYYNSSLRYLDADGPSTT